MPDDPFDLHSRASIPREAHEERALVDGLLARDPRSTTEFLRRTHHPVYCMACRLARDVETRRDWSHDVLLGILDDLGHGRFTYRGPGSFWGWFKKRAYFRLLDRYRRVKLDGDRESSRGGTGDLPEIRALGIDDPSDELERVEVRAAVEACLAKLANTDHRRALDLLLFEELTYETIAQTLGAPLNTVRAWIRRGRVGLRRCLVHSLGLADPLQLLRRSEGSLERRGGA